MFFKILLVMILGNQIKKRWLVVSISNQKNYKNISFS
ncbi:hypothetical protein VO54_01447 [Elizabethkingia miricola]|nr:hypothetical protein VO54_01447 [Elizabethkingia miricola]